MTLSLRKCDGQARDPEIAATQPAVMTKALDYARHVATGIGQAAAAIERGRRDAGDLAAHVDERAAREARERLERRVNRLLEPEAW